MTSTHWSCSMNKQQADYCDALSSGNVEPWKPGLMALMTIDEAVRWEQDTGGVICLMQAVDNEEIAADVADKAIMRMMENG